MHTSQDAVGLINDLFKLRLQQTSAIKNSVAHITAPSYTLRSPTNQRIIMSFSFLVDISNIAFTLTREFYFT